MTAQPVSACWKSADARSIFLTEALEGSDAVFLATHSPIEGFDVDGRDAGEFDSHHERAVLETLSAPDRRHAFCVVQGEPGSGKSHLIRWLSVNWPTELDVKLLLRRADGSLEGALRQLKERLPSEFSSLFDNLGQKHRASAQGRANIFLSTLANTLEPAHFDPPMGDEDWCSTNSPAELLGHSWVKQRWKGPTRILELLEGAGGERNSATASFDLFDIEALAACCGQVYGSGVTGGAERLAQRLIREAETIQAFREAGWTAEETAVKALAELKTSLKFVDVLNRRRNDAIQNVLGVSAQGLKTLFRSVRQALQARGQRLVLLLEDITSWEGLDDSLIDVLVFNADARGDDDQDDVCPLISVVGVTPAYYDKLPGNYRQRITHDIRLGQSHGGLQDVATLRDPISRRRFVSRYLAAVRAGIPALTSWRDTLRGAPQTPPPNVCEHCPRQPSCFASFGSDDGVGLFPFTANAVERFFDALKENDNGQTWRTPRGLLQAVLNPNLAQPETLEAGTYPGPLIEATAIREDRRSDRVLAHQLAQIVANRVSGQDEQARMRRTIAFWGDPERSVTTEIEGELAFAGVRRSLFEAFALPWIGADTASGSFASASVPTATAESLSAPESQLPVEREDPPPQLTSMPHLRGISQRQAVVVPKPQRLAPKRTEIEQRRAELRSWASGSAIENASRWNAMLWNILKDLNPRKLGVSRFLYDRIVTQDMVKLEGSTSGGRDYIVIGRDPWLIGGLEAYLALPAYHTLTSDEAAAHRRTLAVMMRRLEALVRDYLNRRIPSLASDARWAPAATLAQLLLVRAWLRGTVSPEAKYEEQLSAILSDEAEAGSDPRARCQPWQDWLNATDKWHDRIRSALREMVSLSIADGTGGASLTDVSDIAGALVRLQDTARVDEVPESDGGGLPEELRKARELALIWQEKWALIDRTESTQIRNRCETLLGLLRTRAADEHLKRVDNCVTRIAELLPTAGPDKVSAWKQAYARILPRLEDGTGERVEGLIVALEDPDSGLPSRIAARFGWLARAPAKDLEELLTLTQLGESVVAVLYAYAHECVREAAGAGSLESVKAVGQAMKAAVASLDAARRAAE
ncbi:hypothetical protein NKH63_28635 [Mesorhizobium sp. M0960]|uniref:hypothetical protein n=1 Tax=Mesorhizobium sp. M0960 TaxID=2957035 RepID=UPI00333782ED